MWSHPGAFMYNGSEPSLHTTTDCTHHVLTTAPCVSHVMPNCNKMCWQPYNCCILLLSTLIPSWMLSHSIVATQDVLSPLHAHNAQNRLLTPLMSPKGMNISSVELIECSQMEETKSSRSSHTARDSCPWFLQLPARPPLGLASLCCHHCMDLAAQPSSSSGLLIPARLDYAILPLIGLACCECG